MFLNKIFSFIGIVSILLYFTPVVNAEEWNNYFVVTAYYSPLPDQEYYITGDYQKELRLNGQWIAWASGKWVFSGMLAAPGKYSFGTKVYLDGLGIGSVEDRGGAIVPAGQRWYSYDRIDVWMGYGDEGLRRANFWGKRTVYGYVVDSWNNTTIDYTNVPAPGWAITGLKKAGSTTTINLPVNTEIIKETSYIVPSVFDVSLGIWSDSSSISEMQSIFAELGYMQKDYTDGEYDEITIDSIVDFQMEHAIISDPYEIWAGSFGPKTREWLKKLYDDYILAIAEQEKIDEEIEEIKEEALGKASKYVESIWIPKYGDISSYVRELQKSLSTLWYFEYKDTAIFWVKTQNALIKYQLQNKVITSGEELWAGVFWPKTREQFTNDIKELYFKELLQEKELYDRYLENLNTEEEISENEEEAEEILQNVFEEQGSLI